MTLNPQVTGRDELTDARYQIATTDGLLVVEGCVYGDFGLHPVAGTLALSHLPTGRVLKHFTSWHLALLAISEPKGSA